MLLQAPQRVEEEVSVEPDETLRISVGEHAYSLPRASCKSASFTEVSKNYSWLKEKDFFILQQRFIYEMNFFCPHSLYFAGLENLCPIAC